MKKTFLPTLLALALCLVLLPASAFAENAEITYYSGASGATTTASDYTVLTWDDVEGGNLSGVYYVDGKTNDMGYTTFTGDTTLILGNGVTLSTGTINVESGSLTITTVAGATNAKLVAHGGDAAYGSYGIYVEDGDVSIYAGTVEATGGAASDSDSYGIYAESGSVTVANNATVTATGDTPTNDCGRSYGIYASSSVTVSDNATVTATGGTASGDYSSSYGIYAEGGMTVSGSATVTANGGTASDTSCGIYAEGYNGMTVTGGTVKATGGEASTSYGIYTQAGSTQYAFKATGGEVTAKGGTATDTSYGLYSNSGAYSQEYGSTVTATAGTASGSTAKTYGAYIQVSGLNTTNVGSGASLTVNGDLYVNTQDKVDLAGKVTVTGDAGLRGNGGIAIDLTVDGALTATMGSVNWFTPAKIESSSGGRVPVTFYGKLSYDTANIGNIKIALTEESQITLADAYSNVDAAFLAEGYAYACDQGVLPRALFVPGADGNYPDGIGGEGTNYAVYRPTDGSGISIVKCTHEGLTVYDPSSDESYVTGTSYDDNDCCVFCGKSMAITYYSGTGGATTTTSTYTALTATDTYLDGGTYLVQGEVHITDDEGLYATGDTTLVLADGATLTVDHGIWVNGDLTVTTEKGATGAKLVANDKPYDEEGYSNGHAIQADSVSIYAGEVEATGGENPYTDDAATPAGSFGIYATTGDVTIANSAKVTATGANVSGGKLYNGLGSISGARDGDPLGGLYGSFGIYAAGTVTVSDTATVTAKGGTAENSTSGSARVAGSYGIYAKNVSITGGTVTATGDNATAKKGSEDKDTTNAQSAGIFVLGGSTVITGSSTTVTATSGTVTADVEAAACIYGGAGGVHEEDCVVSFGIVSLAKAVTDSLTISEGATVKATGGDMGIHSAKCEGSTGDGGVIISGSATTVEATGGGGGICAKNGMTVEDSTIRAYSSKDATSIAIQSTGRGLTISGAAKIYANANDDGTRKADCGDATTATGDVYSYGIDADGLEISGGLAEIYAYGGNVETSKGGQYAESVGIYLEGSNATATIDAKTVVAVAGSAKNTSVNEIGYRGDALSYGLYGGLNVTGGTVTVSSGTVDGGSDSVSCDVFAEESDITVSGGTVQSDATGAAVKVIAASSNGFYGTVTLDGGTIKLAEGSEVYKVAVGEGESVKALLAKGCAFAGSDDNEVALTAVAAATELTVKLCDHTDAAGDLDYSVTPPCLYCGDNDPVSPITYYTATGTATTLNYTELTADNVSEVSSGIYYINSTLTVDSDLSFTGDTTLVLGSGATLTAKTISCTGSLTVTTVKDATGAKLVAKGGDVTDGNSYGINATGSVNIYAGTVEATGGNATGNYAYSYGIYALKGMTVSGGKVTATGGTAYYSYGLYVSNTMSVTGGEVTAKSGTASSKSCGIYASKALTVSGGTVEATGGTVTATGGSSYGLYASNTMSVSGGEVEATGGTASSNSYGINAEKGMTVSGGKVTATGGAASSNSYGIYAYGGTGMTVSGGTVKATGGTVTATGGSSYGIYAYISSGTALSVSDTAAVEATGGTETVGNSSANSYGIYAKGDSGTALGISDTATVTATGGNVTLGSSYGIYAESSSGSMTVSGGTVTAKSGESSTGYGLYANNTVNVTGGTVNATGSKATGGNSYGLYAVKALTVSGGKVEAKSDSGSQNSYGLYASDTMSVTGGEVEATGGSASQNNSYGIFAQNAMTVSGGTVAAKSGEAAASSYGIHASSGMTVSDTATVNATGGTATGSNSCGIYAGGDMTVSGGTVTTTGGEATNSYDIFVVKRDLTVSGGTVQGDTNGAAVKVKTTKKTDGTCGAVTLSGGTLKLAEGSIIEGTLKTTVTGAKLVDYLADNTAYEQSSAIVSGDVAELTGGVNVVEHFHNFRDNGACDCGCQMPVFARVYYNHENAGRVSSYAYGETIAGAVSTAETSVDGTIINWEITLCGDATDKAGSVIKGGLDYSLNLVGYSYDGKITVGESASDSVRLTVCTSTDGGKITTLEAYGGMLTLEENVEIGTLTALSGSNRALKGFLASGKAYATKDANDTWQEYTVGASDVTLTNVKIVPAHTHSIDSTTGLCTICNEPTAVKASATVSETAYTGYGMTITEALTALKTNAAVTSETEITLTLRASVGDENAVASLSETLSDGHYTLDLNGMSYFGSITADGGSGAENLWLKVVDNSDGKSGEVAGTLQRTGATTCTVYLYAGTYGKVEDASAAGGNSVGLLLGKGDDDGDYFFFDADTGKVASTEGKTSLENVTVEKCAHETYKNGACTVCGTKKTIKPTDNWGADSVGYYYINSIEDLMAFKNKVDGGTNFAAKTVRLTADLDLDGYLWEPIGYSGMWFAGTFVGGKLEENGDFTECERTIKNMSVDTSKLDSGRQALAGLFAYLGDGATIENLTLENASVNGGQGAYVGAIAGCGYNAKLVNCKVTSGTVTGTKATYVGGIVGNTTGTTKSCSFSGKVTGTSATYVGGIAGMVSDSNISGCTVTGGTITGTEATYVGGIVGEFANTGSTTFTVLSCTVDATSSVTGGNTQNDQSYTGGIVGNMNIGNNARGVIAQCANYASVSGSHRFIGGLVGCATRTDISDSFNQGNVTKTGSMPTGWSAYSCVGGLVGEYIVTDSNYNMGSATTIANCYSVGEVTDSSGSSTDNVDLGLLIGNVETSREGATGVLTNSYHSNERGDGSTKAEDVIDGDWGGKITTGEADFDEVSFGKAEKTASQFASGEVAWLLNNGRTVWGQSLDGTSSYPVLDSEKIVRKVVFLGSSTESDVLETFYVANGMSFGSSLPNGSGITGFKSWVKESGDAFDGDTVVESDLTIYPVTRANRSDITVSVDNFVAGNTPPTPTLSDSSITSGVTYYYRTEGVGGRDVPWSSSPLSAGNYVVWAEIAQDEDYLKYTTAEWSFTVAEAVAKVRGTLKTGSQEAPVNYGSVEDAIAAMNAMDSATYQYAELTLLADQTLTGNVSINASFGNTTLDLGGWTLTGDLTVNTGDKQLAVHNGTVKGNVTVSGGYLNIYKYNDAGGTVEGNVTVSGGTVSVYTADTTGGGTITGDVTVNSGALKVQNGGTVTGTVKVNGGEFVVKDGAVFTGDVYVDGGTTAILGGTFKDVYITENAAVTLYGGKFTKLICAADHTVAQYLDTGKMCYVTDGGNGFWHNGNVMELANFEVKTCTHASILDTGACEDCGKQVYWFKLTADGVSDSFYADWKSAIAAVSGKTNPVLTLLSDYNEQDNMMLKGSFTLELNEKALKALGTISVTNGASVTIRGYFDDITATEGVTVESGGSLTVSGGTFTSAVSVKAGGALTVEYGNFDQELNVASGATVKLKGSNYSSIKVADGMTVADLLADGYAFYSDSDSKWYGGAGCTETTLSDVVVKTAPIYDVEQLKAALSSSVYGQTNYISINFKVGPQGQMTVPFYRSVTNGSDELLWEYKYEPRDENSSSSLNLNAGLLPLAVGEHTIYVKIAHSSGYSVVSNSVSITITKADASVSDENKPTAKADLAYNGQPQALVTAGTATGGTMMYRLGTDGAWSDTVPTATNAGDYTVYYYVKGDANHNGSGSEAAPLGSVSVSIRATYCVTTNDDAYGSCACGVYHPIQMKAYDTANNYKTYYYYAGSIKDLLDCAAANSDLEVNTITLDPEMKKHAGYSNGVLTESALTFSLVANYKLDLGGNTLESDLTFAANNGYVTIVNGTVDGSILVQKGVLVLGDSDGDASKAVTVTGDLTYGDKDLADRGAVSGTLYVGTKIAGTLSTEYANAYSTSSVKYLYNLLDPDAATNTCKLALQDSSNKLVDGYKNTSTANVTVVAHTHEGTENGCACGLACNHTTYDANGVCDRCNYQLPVKAVACDSNGAALATAWKLTIKDALEAVSSYHNTSSYEITLKGDQTHRYNSSELWGITGSTPIKLDLAGCALGGNMYVDGGSLTIVNSVAKAGRLEGELAYKTGTLQLGAGVYVMDLVNGSGNSEFALRSILIPGVVAKLSDGSLADKVQDHLSGITTEAHTLHSFTAVSVVAANGYSYLSHSCTVCELECDHASYDASGKCECGYQLPVMMTAEEEKTVYATTFSQAVYRLEQAGVNTSAAITLTPSFAVKLLGDIGDSTTTATLSETLGSGFWTIDLNGSTYYGDLTVSTGYQAWIKIEDTTNAGGITGTFTAGKNVNFGLKDELKYYLYAGTYGKVVDNTMTAGDVGQMVDSDNGYWFFDANGNIITRSEADVKELTNVTVKEQPRTPVTAPSADTTQFVYNGSAQTYTVAENDAYTVSGNVQTNAGSYTVTVSLKDTARNKWDDGTTADKTFTFTIAQKVLTENTDYTAPTGKSGLLFNPVEYYNSGLQLVNAGSCGLTGYAVQYSLDKQSWTTDATAIRGKTVKEYTVYWYIAGDENCAGVGSANEPKSFTVRIEKSKPVLSGATLANATRELTYTGSEQYLLLEWIDELGNDTQGMEVNVNCSHDNYQSYTATYRYEQFKEGTNNDLFRLEYRLGEDGDWTTDYGQIRGTNAGQYTVYLRVAPNEYTEGGWGNLEPSDPVAVTVIIKKADSTGTAPTANALTYNGGAQALVTAGTATGGTMMYRLGTDGDFSTTVPTATNAGSYTVYWYVKGDANHNDSATNFVTVSIAKAAITPTDYTSPRAIEPTYNGGEQQLITAGTASGGTMMYRLGTDGAWTTDVTTITGTNATTYTVYWYVAGDGNHGDSAIKSVSVTIVPKDITNATVTLGNSLAYTGSEQTQTVASVVIDGLTVTYTVSGNTGTDVGDYELTVTGTGNFTGTAKKAWSIVKAGVATGTAPTANTLTYNGSAQALVTAGTASGGTMQYSLDKQTWTTDLTTIVGTNAGDYTVYWYVKGDANHDDSSIGDVTVSIAKAEQTVTAPSVVGIYGDTGKRVSASGIGRLTYEVAGESAEIVSVNATTGELTFLKAGKATVTVTAAGDENHKQGTVNVTVSIAKAAPVTPTDLIGYKGNALSSVTLPSGWTWDDGSIVLNESGTFAASYEGNENYIASRGVSIAVTVSSKTQKTLTVAMNGWTYGDTPNAPQFDCPAGVTAEIVYSYDQTGTPTAAAPTNAGTHTVSVKYETATEIWIGGASFTIAPKDITNATVTLGASLAYTGSEQTQTVTSVVIDGLTVTYTVSGNTGTDVGDYELTVTGTGNFTGTAKKAWSIVKAGVATGTAPTANTLTYNGSAQALVTAGTASGGTMMYRLGESGQFSTTVPTATNAGSYTVYWYVAGDGNHGDSTAKSVSVTIAPKPVTAPSADATQFVYTGNAQTYTVAASNDYTVSGNVQTAAGSYTVTVALKDKANTVWVGGSTDDLAFDFIIAKQLTSDMVTVRAKYTYTGSTVTATVTVTDGDATLVEGVDYTLSGNTATEVGSYTVTVTGKGLYAGVVSKDWKINTRSISVGMVTITGDAVYDGTSHSQTVTVTGNNGTLTEGVDYTVTGTTSATELGTYHITVTGKGDYAGEVTVEWRIEKAGRALTWTGSGTQSDPYVIDSAEELEDLAYVVNHFMTDPKNNGEAYSKLYYKLGDDIDYGNNEWTPIGDGRSSVVGGSKKYAAFAGHFDGNGKTVSGLVCSDEQADDVGLFGRVAGGSVRNVTVESSSFTGRQSVGGIVGQLDGTVEGCVNRASVSGTHEGIGGIVGGSFGTVEGCTNYGAVNGTASAQAVGGIVGGNYGTVSGCTNSGAVSAARPGDVNLGGIAGFNNAAITKCINSGSVTYTYTGSGYYFGGIAGYNSVIASISDSANTGTVSGGDSGYYVGGILGCDESSGATGVSRCYNTGAVYGKMYVGGITGKANTLIKDCYNTGTINGERNVGGIAGMVYTKHGKVESCYSIGTIQPIGNANGRIDLGAVTGNSSNCGGVSNSYYLEGCGGYADNNRNSTAKTAEEFKDGTVKSLLNDDAVWMQGVNYPLLRSIPHSHSWSYSVSGSTITAVCVDAGCDTAVNSTLTISAPTTTVYDGSGKAATLSAASVGGVTSLPAIRYEKQTDAQTWAAMNAAPVDAGTYRASITVAGVTAYVEFTIATRTAGSAEFATPNKSVTYSGSPVASELSAIPEGVASVSYRYVGANGYDSATAPTDAGSYTVTASFTMESGYTQLTSVSTGLTIAPKDITNATVTLGNSLSYTGSEQTQTVTSVVIDGLTVTYTVSGNTATNVGDYELTVTGTGNFTGTAKKAWSISQSGSATGTAPTANALTYNGGAQVLVSAGTATGGTMMYRLGENGQFSTTVPTATNAGSYTVYWYVKGDANHGDSSVKSVSVTIAPKDITNATVTLGASLAYNGSEQTQTVTSVKVDGLDATYTVSGNTGTNVGDYELTVTGTGNFTGTAKKGWSIAQSGSATGTAPTANALTYTGSAQALVTAGTATGGTMMYRLGENGQFSTTVPTATNAGSYTVYWYVKGDANHGDSSVKSVSVTIAPKDITNATVTLGNSLAYTGSEQTQTVTSVVIDGLDVTYTVSGNTATNVGDYELTVTGTGNFTGTAKKAWSISQSGSATGTAPTANALTYTGGEQQLITAGTATGGTMMYRLGESGQFSTAIPTAMNAGSYTVYWYVAGDGNHGDSTTASVNVTIAPKDITNATVTLGDSLAYTGSEQTQTVTSVVIDGLTVTYTVSGNTATNVGDYELTVTGTGNFTGTAKKGWSISQSGSATGTAPTANALTYNGGEQVLVTAGTASGGTMMYRLGENGDFSATIPTAMNAGSYTVYWYVKGDANHGDSDVKSVSVTIAPKDITNATVTLGNSLSYTGSVQTQTVTSVVIDGLTVTYTVSGNTATNVGDYELTVTGTGNFTGTAKKGWNIAQSGSATGTAPTANALTYNGQPQVLVSAGTASGGTMYYSLDQQRWTENVAEIVGTNAGSYTVYWYVAGDGNHGDSVTGNVSVTIAPKDIANATVTLGNSLSYTGSVQTQTVTSVKVDGVTLDPSEYTVSSNTGTNVGDYELTVTGTGNFTGTAKKAWSIAQSGSATGTAPTANALTYNGGAQALITAGTATGGTMMYRLGENGQFSAAIPTATNAGSYTVYWYVAGDGNHGDSTAKSVSVTIAPKDITNATVTLGASLAYTGSEQTQTVTSVVIDGLTVTYTVSGNTGTNVGDYELTVTGTGNFTGTAKKAWSIAQSGSATGTAPTANALTYDGSEQTLVTAGTATGGTMMYRLGTDGAWTTDVTTITGTNAGSYTVYWYVAGDGNHGNSNVKSVSVTIAAKPVTAPSADATQFVYTGNAQTYTVAVSNDYTVSGNVRTNAGSYTVTVALKDKANTQWADGSTADKTFGFTIAKAKKLLTVTITGWTYGDAPNAPQYDAVAGATNLKVLYSFAGAATPTTTVPTNAGGYTVAVQYETANEVYTGEASFTIAKAAMPAPTFGKITESGKYLAEVDWEVDAMATLTWDDGEYTKIERGKSYNWTLTATDGNRETLTGSYTPWEKPASTPSTPPTTTVKLNATIRSDHGKAEVSATVNKGHADVQVTDEEIAHIIDDHAGEVKVDVSELKNVTNATLPAHVIEKTDEAKDTGLTVSLATGAVTLDETALGSVASSGEDVNISVVSVPTSIVPDAVKKLVGMDENVAAVVDVDVTVGGTKKSGFNGGKVTISVPYTPKAGEDTSKLTVWFIRDDGTIENKGGYYDAENKCFVFETTHLSRYVLVNTTGMMSFTDVSADSWYAEAVKWATDSGVTTGTSETTFSPDMTCTRAQIVTFLYRAAGSPEAKSASGFTDVSADAWYAKAVAWAVEQGITTGTSETTFSPDMTCTRAQAVVFLFRYAAANGMEAVTLQELVAGYSDAESVPDYSLAAFNWALAKGVVQGADGKLLPNSDCTRSQIVTMLYRSMNG